MTRNSLDVIMTWICESHQTLRPVLLSDLIGTISHPSVMRQQDIHALKVCKGLPAEL